MICILKIHNSDSFVCESDSIKVFKISESEVVSEISMFCLLHGVPLQSLPWILMNSNDYSNEWAALNLNQIFTSRQTTFITTKTNTKKVGLNALANRFDILNNRIPLSWFNKSIDVFKVHFKKGIYVTVICWWMNEWIKFIYLTSI